MKVAIVYDRANKWGGAETVLLALQEIFPDAPLYTSVFDPSGAPWGNKFIQLNTSFIQRLPLPKDRHEYYPILMGPAFESMSFDNYDVVISVTHEFAKAIITKPATLHICYCLNPTGYLWENRADYLSSKSDLFQFLADPILRYLQWYDQIVAYRPDTYIAISQVVKDRIKKYYHQDSLVIYPPVTVNHPKFTTKPQGDYYLIVSRLVPNKRLDIAVTAFNKLKLPLKIIGTGVEESRLKKLASPNIEFLGFVSDIDLASYYHNCRAVIVPGVEDFGIVAVEAQSWGRPVLAQKAGGVVETVVEGKTGYFFTESSAASLVSLLKKVDLSKIKSDDCRENARKFSKINFQRQFKKTVVRLWEEKRI